MAQAIESLIAPCPLCGEALDLNIPDHRVAAGWRDVLEYRNLWPRVVEQFRSERSIEAAAKRLSIKIEIAARLLDFLCSEVCGCRAVICVSCLDDYRSEL
ncbi:MAG TPA: hypothetical protein VLD57_04550 [Blastocatellia bacterium]|nr:hypothetical protein [Blastocatellia bacterium]